VTDTTEIMNAIAIRVCDSALVAVRTLARADHERSDPIISGHSWSRLRPEFIAVCRDGNSDTHAKKPNTLTKQGFSPTCMNPKRIVEITFGMKSIPILKHLRMLGRLDLRIKALQN